MDARELLDQTLPREARAVIGGALAKAYTEVDHICETSSLGEVGSAQFRRAALPFFVDGLLLQAARSGQLANATAEERPNKRHSYYFAAATVSSGLILTASRVLVPHVSPRRCQYRANLAFSNRLPLPFEEIPQTVGYAIITHMGWKRVSWAYIGMPEYGRPGWIAGVSVPVVVAETVPVEVPNDSLVALREQVLEGLVPHAAQE